MKHCSNVERHSFNIFFRVEADIWKWWLDLITLVCLLRQLSCPGLPLERKIHREGFLQDFIYELICLLWDHYDDIIMGVIASQITSLAIVYSAVYSDADQRKHQSSASLAFVRGIHQGPVNSPHKWPVAQKMFPFDGVIMSPRIQGPVATYRLTSIAIPFIKITLYLDRLIFIMGTPIPVRRRLYIEINLRDPFMYQAIFPEICIMYFGVETPISYWNGFWAINWQISKVRSEFDFLIDRTPMLCNDL